MFAVSDAGQKANSQQIVIFSAKGEYLYRGQTIFGQGLKFSGSSNLILKDGFAYVVLENDQGQQSLAKYRIL